MIIFTFTYDAVTKDASFVGNIGIREALSILQDITVTDMLRQLEEEDKAKAKKDKKKDDSS